MIIQPDFGFMGAGRWLVGVSGGGDSVALLRLLVEAGLREQVVVGNFEHGWGDFGVESALFVRGLVGDLGFEYVEGKGGGKAANNAEAVAREERYGWFESVCKRMNLHGVLVAHTRDDVVETFLMRAGKGSGLQGLAGMKVESEYGGMRVLRPLLGCGREALRDYLRGVNQGWMEDPDNENGGSQRARVRKLLPLLEAAGVTIEGLAASGEALAQANEAITDIVDVFVGSKRVIEGSERATVELSELRGVPVEIAVRILGKIIGNLGHGGMIVRRSKRIFLWQRLCAEDSGAATLGGVKFNWGKGRLSAVKE